MTQDIIKKLHLLEEKRQKWYKFREALIYKNNITVADYAYTPVNILYSISNSNINNWDEFKSYILDYVDQQIEMCDVEIEKL